MNEPDMRSVLDRLLDGTNLSETEAGHLLSALTDAQLPPAMAGALLAARVGRLVFGASDPRAGACGTLYNLCGDPRLNHEVPITPGVRAPECSALLTSFFAGKRPLSSSPAPASRGPSD